MTRLVMAALAATVLVGCGGAQPTGEKTAPLPKEDNDGDAQTNKVSTMVSPEVLDEITAYFKKKRLAVTQCQITAIQNGKLDKKSEGAITLEMSISPQGKPENVRVARSSLQSKEVEDCLIKMIGNWTVAAPGSVVPFSFAYGFHAE